MPSVTFLDALGDQCALLTHTLSLQAERHQWRAGSQAQQLITFALIDIRQCLSQPVLALRRRRLRARNLLTATLDGRQQATGLMAYQQQHRVARGLFQALEQCIRGIDVHRLDRLDQHHLASALLGGLNHESNQITHLIDLDRLVGLFRFEHKVVGMAASLEQQAGFTLAARLRSVRFLA